MRNFTAAELQASTSALVITSLIPPQSMTITTLPGGEEIANWRSVHVVVNRVQKNVYAHLVLERPNHGTEEVSLPVEQSAVVADLAEVEAVV